ncbi:MAG: hypothetical protein ABSB19_06490 [Methylomonas sp.]|jgi:hypothetical protein
MVVHLKNWIKKCHDEAAAGRTKPCIALIPAWIAGQAECFSIALVGSALTKHNVLYVTLKIWRGSDFSPHSASSRLIHDYLEMAGNGSDYAGALFRPEKKCRRRFGKRHHNGRRLP